MGASAQAAPIGVDDAAPTAVDPYELAVRWTLASLGPDPGPAKPAEAPAAAAPRFRPLPFGTPEASVPDPMGYALMGLALLGVGLAARRLSPPQRGFSKKT
jgi:hypothetical protein